MPQLKTVQRWDLVGISLIALLGMILVFLLDTGSVAEWIARHKHTKIDEIVFTALALLIVLWLFSTRKWWDLSRLVTRYEESPQQVHSPELNRMRAAFFVRGLCSSDAHITFCRVSPQWNLESH
jgi:hypothetical protein